MTVARYARLALKCMGEKKKKGIILFTLTFYILILFALFESQHANANTELLVNGGFEDGTLNGWNIEGANQRWLDNQPVKGDWYEGSYGIYINPNDHGDVILSQRVSLSTSSIILKFAILPHTGYSPGNQYHSRAVIITALDINGNTFVDNKGKKVELIYSLVGDYETSGYKLSFDLPLRNPNTEPFYFFERSFSDDYQDAGLRDGVD